MVHAWQALQEVGLVPAEAACPPAGADAQDLLPCLGDAWTRLAAAAPANRRAQRVCDWCAAWQRHDARLTWGLPDAAAPRGAAWLGPRLAWWPHGIPPGRRVGVVSSRLGQSLQDRPAWFTVLRAAAQTLRHEEDLLVTSAASAAGRFVTRAGELFGIRVLEVDLPSRTAAPADWGRHLLAQRPPESSGSYRVLLSPPLSSVDLPAGWSEAPEADRAVFALSDRLFALWVRPGGNLEALVQRRLEEDQGLPARIYLALGPDLVPPDLAESWMARGAIGWCVLNVVGQPQVLDDAAWQADRDPWHPPAPVRKLPRVEDWPYLTHCTRRRPGPWPDEDERHYLDDLILDRRGADHSAFAALWRIVQTRRLLATSDLLRGDVPAVCWTAVPLGELPQLRAFRSHLGRWDFEPYGVCVLRSWLEERGARPVIYGDEEVWQQLAQAQRPFFQKSHARSPSGHMTDWTLEREWRQLGDADLHLLPAAAGFVFVPTAAQARALAAISPWPVIVV